MARPAADAPKAADRILATAGELFYREGARAVGVDEIVAKAATTKPSLYRAFGSKDQLIAAYLETRAAQQLAELDAAVAARPDDPRAQVLAWVDAVSRPALKAGYRGCGVSNTAVEYPDARHPGHKGAVRHKEALRERLRELTKAMGAKKPKRLADALLLLVEGVFITGQMFGEKGPAASAHGAAEALIEAHAREAGGDE